MGTKTIKTEGGQGGRRGHSNMTHWTGTEEIKAVSKKARRKASKAIIKRDLAEE
jgi:hypothetical protein